MPSEIIGIIGFAIMFALMLGGVPIAIAMATIGFLGTVYFVGFPATFAGVMSLVPFSAAAKYELVAMALFLLMGNIAFHSAMAEDLFKAAQHWIGRLPAGLSLASLAACAGFSAVTGSSVACAVAIGSIALPEMTKQKYDKPFSAGVLAAGGTLGILIPPSTGFIIYGAWTETAIHKLFIAGIVPGIILVTFYMLVAVIRAKINPSLAPSYKVKSSWGEKFRLLGKCGPILVLFLFLMVGMWAGWFTPVEAGGMGVVAVILITIATRKFNFGVWINAMRDAGRTTAMIMAIVVGASLMVQFVALSRFNVFLVETIQTLGVTFVPFMGLCFVMYLALGCLLDVIGMLLLTLPILFPVVQAMGIDPIWFGVFIVITCEMALITPPVGINCFAIAGVAEGVPLESIFKNILPFLLAQVATIAVLMLFPQIATFLLETMPK